MPLATSHVGAAEGRDLLIFSAPSKTMKNQKIAAFGSSYKKMFVYSHGMADGLVLRTNPDLDRSTTARSIRR
jgi:hypothetical protein